MSDELTEKITAMVLALADWIIDLVKERDAARAEVKFYKDREEHFARVLSVCDGGQYRADWDGALHRLIDERDRLLAIVEGSTVPPTDAEIEVHHARGGGWLVEGVQLKLSKMGAMQLRDACVQNGRVCRWVPIREGRPCARPTVATGEVKP